MPPKVDRALTLMEICTVSVDVFVTGRQNAAIGKHSSWTDKVLRLAVVWSRF